MIIPSITDVEKSPTIHDMYHQQWEWLLNRYGKDIDGKRTINPEDVIDHLCHTVIKTNDGNKHKYVGDLKDGIEDVDALSVGMICAGGYEHGGGKSELFGDRGIYVMVIKS